jgi:hypothetical protein
LKIQRLETHDEEREWITQVLKFFKICPKCDKATSMLLPDFNNQMIEIGKSCPKCKKKEKHENTTP